jgi:hypothetical protein
MTRQDLFDPEQSLLFGLSKEEGLFHDTVKFPPVLPILSLIRKTMKNGRKERGTWQSSWSMKR